MTCVINFIAEVFFEMIFISMCVCAIDCSIIGMTSNHHTSCGGKLYFKISILFSEVLSLYFKNVILS